MEENILNYNKAREQIISKPNNSIVIFKEYLSEKYFFWIKWFIKKIANAINQNNQVYYIWYWFEPKEQKICEELWIPKNIIKSDKLLSEKEFVTILEQLKSLKSIKFTDFSYFWIEPKIKEISYYENPINLLQEDIIKKESSLSVQIEETKKSDKFWNSNLKINKLRNNYEKFLEFYFSIKNSNSDKESVVKKFLNTPDVYVFQNYIAYKEENNFFTIIRSFITEREEVIDFATPALTEVNSIESLKNNYHILKTNSNDLFLEANSDYIFHIKLNSLLLDGKVKFKQFLHKDKCSLFNSVIYQDDSGTNLYFLCEYKNKEYIGRIQSRDLRRGPVSSNLNNNLDFNFIKSYGIVNEILEQALLKTSILRNRTITIKNVKVDHYKNDYRTWPAYLHEALNSNSFNMDNEQIAVLLNWKSISHYITSLHFTEGGLNPRDIQQYGFVPLLNEYDSWGCYWLVYLKVNDLYYLFSSKFYYIGSTMEDITKLSNVKFLRKNSKVLNSKLFIMKNQKNEQLQLYYKDLLELLNNSKFQEDKLSVNDYNWD